jgi:endonuclease YncB( thermonuclease family)
MFWRRPAQGFDWHKYVPTTVLLRRKARRDKLEDAGRAALAHVQAAGGAAVAGAQKGGAATASGLARLSAILSRAIAGLFGPLGRGFIGALSMLLEPLTRPGIASSLALVGLVTLASACYRVATVGLDFATVVPCLLGALALAPMLVAATAPPTARLDRRLAFGAVGIVLIATGALAAAHLATPRGERTGTFAAWPNFSFFPVAQKPIEGRGAVVIAPDTFRLDGKVIRLDGVEPPDRGQMCLTGTKKRSRCSDSGQAALERTVRGRMVTCQPTAGADASGRIVATCASDGRDIASELVKAGLLFSTSTYLGGYAIEESEARHLKVGVWSTDTERPSEFRAKLWDAAKATSPNGCPIKGMVASGSKIYLAPWTSDYGKATVRPSRGERWFCSEEEAQLAGWRSAERN